MAEEKQLRQLDRENARGWQRHDQVSHQEYQQQGHSVRHCPHQQDWNIYDTYIAKNNQGALLLREKRYQDAACCFCQAVKYVNERSEFHYPNNELQNTQGLRQDQHRVGLDLHRHTSSRPTTSSANVPPIPNIYSSAAMPISTTETPRVILRAKVDSFYLLLDDESKSKSNSCNNCGLHTCQHAGSNSCDDECRQQCGDASFSDDDRTNCEGSYVFRNPIVVVECDPINTIRTSASNNGVENSFTSSTTALVARARATPTFAKDACVKLSLLSVYNLALTYHLAALDNKNHRRMEANNNGLDLHYRNDNDSNVQQPTKRGSPDEVETTSDMSKGTCNRRPSKRQRMASYMDGINNTSGSATNRMKSMISVTPYGECANPYHNDVDNQNDENISDSNDDKINRTLLQQALTYYEIAYRMLVSEENVLVSQAMVILNNIGHIHRLMGSEENAKEYFQRLLTTMMYLQQTSDSRQIKHWDSFFTNVVDLVVPPNLSHKKYAAAA